MKYLLSELKYAYHRFFLKINPGFGLHPKYLEFILVKEAIKSIEKGERFSLNFMSK